MRRLFVLVLVAAFAAVVPAGPASSGGGPDAIAFVSLVSPVEPLTFRVEVDWDTCDEGTVEVTTVEANGNAVTPVAVVPDESDPNAVFVVLPSNTTPGELEFFVFCEDGEFPVSAEGGIFWNSLAVTKVVVGTPPSGATFTVHVECENAHLTGVASAELPAEFEADLHYGVTGGVRYVYSDDSTSCQVTEPNTGGAASVTIVPPVVEMENPEAYSATVTNTFVAPTPIPPNFTG